MLSVGAAPQDAAQILTEVLSCFQEQAREKAAELPGGHRGPAHHQVPPGPPEADLDEPDQQRHQVHAGRGDALSFACRWTGTDLLSTVEDSGIGIDRGGYGQLFQEFYRTDQAKASGEIGTGLGLSIVKADRGSLWW